MAPFISWPSSDLPCKNRADLPEGHELRVSVIAALSLRVSRLNHFFSNLILCKTIFIWNSNVITMEQLRNNCICLKIIFSRNPVGHSTLAIHPLS
jgi:hypothetical protein